MRVFEAVLAALADHGFTPTAIVTRLTWLSAPDSVQGALAAGLLGGGSRFLGVTEDCGRFLHDVIDGLDAVPDRRAGVGRGRARRRTTPARGRDGSCPGSATTSTRTATRAPRGCSRSPARRASSGRTSRCSRRSAGCTPRCSARPCRSTAPGVCGAALADLGLPLELLRGFALLARTAGLIGQLAEELRHPVANDIFLSVDLHNRPVDPDPLPREH